MSKPQPRIKIVNHRVGVRRTKDAPATTVELESMLGRVESAITGLRSRIRSGRLVPGDIEEMMKAARGFINWIS